MPEVTFRFYEELNDFLPAGKRRRDFQSPFKGRESIKDKIEALGVPPKSRALYHEYDPLRGD